MCNTNFQFRQDKPLIVLEAGGGSGAVSFMPLMDSLSSEFRMCAYDRAGYPLDNNSLEKNIVSKNIFDILVHMAGLKLVHCRI